MQRESAETIAIQALAWLAEAELLEPFFGATGTGPDDVRARAADPDFLIAVLDFLTSDDAWVRAFCDGAGLPYEAPMEARQSLPGGAQVHWT